MTTVEGVGRHDGEVLPKLSSDEPFSKRRVGGQEENRIPGVEVPGYHCILNNTRKSLQSGGRHHLGPFGHICQVPAHSDVNGKDVTLGEVGCPEGLDNRLQLRRRIQEQTVEDSLEVFIGLVGFQHLSRLQRQQVCSRADHRPGKTAICKQDGRV